MTVVKFKQIIVVILGIVVTVPITVHAQTTVDQQTPAERCSLVQNYLKTIQKPRDLRARVDRLQAYRYIYQRLDVFVIRLEKNGQPQAAELRGLLEDYSKETEKFKDDYERYDSAREELANMKDCNNSIDTFLQKLQTTRQLRQKVYEDVLAIQKMLSPDISGQLEVLYDKLQSTERTGANV